MQRYYSNIYWHFTGSPEVDWNDVKMPIQIKGKAKPTEESFRILKDILKSRTLLSGKPETIKGRIKTKGFCCVCDIPFKDLVDHSEYYGRIAIGFSATFIHRYFNPVLYIQDDFPIPEELLIDLISKPTIVESKINSSDEEFFKKYYGAEDSPEYEEKLIEYLGYYKNFMKVTMFSVDEEKTFYREREWRKIGNYEFSDSAVEAIIVTKEFVNELKDLLIDLNYNNTQVISFDFLEKA